MKISKKFLIPLIFLIAVPAAFAQYQDTARVVKVIPRIQEYVRPRQECRTVNVQVEQRQRSPFGAIIGGVAGGVLGNQIGHGRGRGTATGLGIAAGALLGDVFEQRTTPPQVVTKPVQECRTVEEKYTQTEGYEITYVYKGQTFTTITREPPGKTIPVNISVTPH